MDFYSIKALSSISQLTEQRRREIDGTVKSLQLRDVESDEDFKSSSERVKNRILFKPVNIEKTATFSHYLEERELPMNFGRYMGTKTINIVSVKFPFSGDAELFEYIPTGIMLSGGKGVLQPDGSYLVVEVEQDVLNKQAAIQAANEQLETTFDVINGNNHFVEQWNAEILPTIEQKLAAWRQELIDFSK